MRTAREVSIQPSFRPQHMADEMMVWNSGSAATFTCLAGLRPKQSQLQRLPLSCFMHAIQPFQGMHVPCSRHAAHLMSFFHSIIHSL